MGKSRDVLVDTLEEGLEDVFNDDSQIPRLTEGCLATRDGDLGDAGEDRSLARSHCPGRNAYSARLRRRALVSILTKPRESVFSRQLYLINKWNTFYY